MGTVLTSAAVAKLKPGLERREVRDAACTGLYLVVQPTGSKSYVLRIRRPNRMLKKGLPSGPLA